MQEDLRYTSVHLWPVAYIGLSYETARTLVTYDRRHRVEYAIIQPVIRLRFTEFLTTL